MICHKDQTMIHQSPQGFQEKEMLRKYCRFGNKTDIKFQLNKWVSFSIRSTCNACQALSVIFPSRVTYMNFSGGCLYLIC